MHFFDKKQEASSNKCLTSSNKKLGFAVRGEVSALLRPLPSSSFGCNEMKLKLISVPGIARQYVVDLSRHDLPASERLGKGGGWRHFLHSSQGPKPKEQNTSFDIRFV